MLQDYCSCIQLVIKEEGIKVLLWQANAGQCSEGESRLFLVLHVDKTSAFISLLVNTLCGSIDTGLKTMLNEKKVLEG